MALSLVAARDISDAPVTLTLTADSLVVGKTYTLTINGKVVGTAVATSTNITLPVQVSLLPVSVQTALASFCAAVSNETIVPSTLGGCVNDVGATTIQIS